MTEQQLVRTTFEAFCRPWGAAALRAEKKAKAERERAAAEAEAAAAAAEEEAKKSKGKKKKKVEPEPEPEPGPPPPPRVVDYRSFSKLLRQVNLYTNEITQLDMAPLFEGKQEAQGGLKYPAFNSLIQHIAQRNATHLRPDAAYMKALKGKIVPFGKKPAASPDGLATEDWPSDLSLHLAMAAAAGMLKAIFRHYAVGGAAWPKAASPARAGRRAGGGRSPRSPRAVVEEEVPPASPPLLLLPCAPPAM
jgi:hypothetical protein